MRHRLSLAALVAVSGAFAIASPAAVATQRDKGHTGDARAEAAARGIDGSASARRQPRAVRRCAKHKRKHSNRCRTERIGRRGKVIGLGKNIGGAGDQYLPFDTGYTVRVSQGNNYRFSHNNDYTRFAWDFAVPGGTTVRATASGTIADVGGGCPPMTTSTACGRGWGNYVVLRHADGSCSRYAHLSRLGVTVGQAVGVYAVLGASGNSGYSLGAHLHYQRENCATRRTITSAFIEAGVPGTNSVVVSQNRADAPPPVVPPVVVPPPFEPKPPDQPNTRVITVYNKVTNGGTQMREDSTPVRLTTQPWKFCGSRGCNINGTERGTGGTYDAAVCQTSGDVTTNGNNADPSDDGNPNLYTSGGYYGVRLANGTFGFVSWVWIQASDRGGLGLPPC